MLPIYSRLAEFFNILFGNYTPFTNPDGTIPSGFAGVDWPYLIRAFAFFLVLYCLFRLLGVVFSR